jgi:hypothetical protein
MKEPQLVPGVSELSQERLASAAEILGFCPETLKRLNANCNKYYSVFSHELRESIPLIERETQRSGTSIKGFSMQPALKNNSVSERAIEGAPEPLGLKRRAAI